MGHYNNISYPNTHSPTCLPVKYVFQLLVLNMYPARVNVLSNFFLSSSFASPFLGRIEDELGLRLTTTDFFLHSCTKDSGRVGCSSPEQWSAHPEAFSTIENTRLDITQSDCCERAATMPYQMFVRNTKRIKVSLHTKSPPTLEAYISTPS